LKMKNAKKEAKTSVNKSSSREEGETVIYSALKSDVANGNGVMREGFTNKSTVEAHSVESVVVRETKTQIASGSVKTKDATNASVVTMDATNASVKTDSNNKMESTGGNKNGLGKLKGSGWDNLVFKKQVALEVKKEEAEIPALEIEELPLETSFENLDTVTKNVMEKILFEYFYLKITSIINISIEVTNKIFRRRIGFGFITDNNRYYKSKAVRVDKSLFFSQEKQSLALSLSGYHPYSEVYNIWQTNTTSGEGRTFFIFRHFLKWDSLTEEQKKSLKVATSLDGDSTNVIIFVDPTFVDEEYVVIEQTDSSWFWVVSKFGSLPLRMKSMFERNQRSSLTCSMSLRGLTMFQKLMLGSFTFEF